MKIAYVWGFSIVCKGPQNCIYMYTPCCILTKQQRVVVSCVQSLDFHDDEHLLHKSYHKIPNFRIFV